MSRISIVCDHEIIKLFVIDEDTTTSKQKHSADFLTRQAVERSDRRRRDCTTPITFWRAKTSLTDDFSILFLFFIHFIYDLQLLPASVRSFCAKFGAMVGRHFDKLITAAKNVIGNSNVAFAIGRSRARCHLLEECEHNVVRLDNLTERRG